MTLRTRLTHCVDPLWQAVYLPLLLLVVVMAAPACVAVTPAAAPPDAAVEARLVTATAPQRRLQVVFDWAVSDRTVNVSGQGVLRLDRGERARVDLFDPRGIALLVAIVEGEDMRAVPAFASTMLPPAALMWSVLGVFRQPSDAPLTRTAVTGDDVTLEYARDGTRWRFRFDDGMLRHTEWTSGAGRRTVALTGTATFDLPQDVHFRDWAEFRELKLNLKDVEEKTAFDADVWILPGDR